MTGHNAEEIARSLEELQREVKELREMVNFLVGYLMSMSTLDDEDDFPPHLMNLDYTLKNNHFSM